MILILGNLYITHELKKQFYELNEQVMCIEVAYEGIEEFISKAKYICACNFNLNKYIDYLNPTQYIIMAETGVVNIDLLEAKSRNLTICNLENYSCDAVVQYIMYCTINELRPWNLYFENRDKKEDIMTKQSIGIETLKVGIVGYGTIGKAVSNVLHAFKCQVLATSRKEFTAQQVKKVNVDKLFEESDIVIVCCNLNNSSAKMIDYNLLSKLKCNSTIISISPMGIFNEIDLGKFLIDRDDVKAYLDFDFNKKAIELNELANVHASPHVAFFTQQTIVNRTEACIQKIRNYIFDCNEEINKVI